jgi:drug/metabolite transporter (DMT)-like permease
MPVGAALCYAGTILTTRRLCREESPVTLALGVATALLIVGSLAVLVLSAGSAGPWARDWPYLFTGWTDIDLWLFALIALCSCLNLTANIGLAKAYQSAEASWLAPFDYSYMIFATFWGFVFWGDIPGALTLTGMAMIAAAGAFVTWRERIAARKEPRP